MVFSINIKVINNRIDYNGENHSPVLHLTWNITNYHWSQHHTPSWKITVQKGLIQITGYLTKYNKIIQKSNSFVNVTKYDNHTIIDFQLHRIRQKINVTLSVYKNWEARIPIGVSKVQSGIDASNGESCH